MDISLIISAFIAGLLTFLAPCTLPLAPAYLSFISGVSLAPLERAVTGLGQIQGPLQSRIVRWRIFLNGLFFVIGFSAVFVTAGALIGFVGASVLAPYRIWLARFGGAFVILFGLTMLDMVRIPALAREKRFRVPQIFERGKPLNAFISGAAFSSGWTPCVGPILGTILLLASTSATALGGTALLATFSAGLAVPFLTIALWVGSASHYLERSAPYLKVVSIVGGIFLISLGFLLMTGNMTLLTAWGYRLFRFISTTGDY